MIYSFKLINQLNIRFRDFNIHDFLPESPKTNLNGNLFTKLVLKGYREGQITASILSDCLGVRVKHINDIEYFHWHIEIIPRLTNIAGFEWGTGFYINPMPPENAAEFLRDTNRHHE